MTSRSRVRAGLVVVTIVAGTAVGGLAAPGIASAGDPVDPSAAVAYQHDPAHDGDSADPALVAPFTVAWSKTLTGRLGYPLIVDGRVFVTTAAASGAGDNLEALSVATGDVLWGPKFVGSPASSTAIAYDAGQVFVVDGGGNVSAYDAATGTRNWFAQMPGQSWFTSPPTALDGTVYTAGAGSGGTLYAVDETTGDLKWTGFVENGDDSSPAVDANGVYVSYACEQAYRFGLDGVLAWHHSTDCEGGGGATDVLHGGRVYVRDNFGKSPAVLDAATGSGVGIYDSATPPAFDGPNMVGVSGGVVTVTDTSTDDLLWSTPVEDAVTAPLVANGYVIEGRGDGTVEARGLGDGGLVWSGHVSGGDLTGQSGLAEGDGVIAVPAGSTLTVFEPAGDTTVTITAAPSSDGYVGRTASFSFSSAVPNAQYVCTLDGQDQPCSSPVKYAGLSDGAHHFSVAVAYASNGAATQTFRADAIAPTVQLKPFRHPVTRRASVTAHWTAFDGESGISQYELRLRQAHLGTPPPAWSIRVPATNSATLRVHRASRLCVSVRAQDQVGNWSGWAPAQCVTRK
jgi:outer membrane protein assembly factor BamB